MSSSFYIRTSYSMECLADLQLYLHDEYLLSWLITSILHSILLLYFFLKLGRKFSLSNFMFIGIVISLPRLASWVATWFPTNPIWTGIQANFISRLLFFASNKPFLVTRNTKSLCVSKSFAAIFCSALLESDKMTTLFLLFSSILHRALFCTKRSSFCLANVVLYPIFLELFGECSPIPDFPGTGSKEPSVYMYM